MQKIQFLVEGQQIDAKIFASRTGNGEEILFIHGWRSSKKNPGAYAVSLAELGYSCMTFDLRGMGESEGDIQKLSRSDYLADCLAAFDKLSEQTGVKSISVVGASFGSYLACLVTKNRPVSNLVLRVPANFPNEGFDEPQIKLSDQLDRIGRDAQKHLPQSTYPLEALREYSGNVLVVASEKDQTIHPSIIQGFVDAVQNDHLTYHDMKGAPHSLSRDEKLKTEYQNILIEWLESQKA